MRCTAQKRRPYTGPSYSSLHGPAVHAEGMATPQRIFFATGNNKKLQEVGRGRGGPRWCRGWGVCV